MMLLIFLPIDVLIVLLLAFTPYVTRKTELFGVSLPAKERDIPALKKLCASFRNMAILVGVIFFGVQFVLAGVSKQEMQQVLILTVGLLIYLAVFFLLYVLYHKRMAAFKAQQPWRAYGRAGVASDGPNGTGEPVLIADTEPAGRDNVSAWWLLLYPVIVAATAICFYLLWPGLPDKIPVHADITGAIDGWTIKDASTFFTMLWPQWLILGVFALTYLMIRMSKRQVDAADPGRSREQGRRFRRIMSGAMVFGGAALSAVIGATMLFLMSGAYSKIVMLSPFVILACCVVLVILLYVRVGQGGSRLRVREKSDITNNAANVDDDRYWKAGIFYYNKKDPSFIVEKRFGIGWTVNFGHPAGIAIMIVIFAVILFAVIVGSVALVVNQA